MKKRILALVVVFAVALTISLNTSNVQPHQVGLIAAYSNGSSTIGEYADYAGVGTVAGALLGALAGAIIGAPTGGGAVATGYAGAQAGAWIGGMVGGA